MNNFLDKDFGKKSESVRASVRVIADPLRSTIDTLKKQGRDKISSDNVSKLSDQELANLVRIDYARVEAWEELYSYIVGVL